MYCCLVAVVLLDAGHEALEVLGRTEGAIDIPRVPQILGRVGRQRVFVDAPHLRELVFAPHLPGALDAVDIRKS